MTIRLSQAEAAVLTAICNRIAELGLAPDEEHGRREVEATIEAQVDFILSSGYRSILVDIRRRIRRERDLAGAPQPGDADPDEACT
ncbi:MAG: hypothetical protein J0H01_15275 [Rhizobiales bacterium]|nr:hypothetical protein [Hyphomicrobiales bacterium]